MRLETEWPMTPAARIIIAFAGLCIKRVPVPAGEYPLEHDVQADQGQNRRDTVDRYARSSVAVRLLGLTETKAGKQVNLPGCGATATSPGYNPISPWQADDDFDSWWGRGKNEFKNVRAASFYRYQLPAFQDLYGVDFDRITDAQAKQLNDRIVANYKDRVGSTRSSPSGPISN